MHLALISVAVAGAFSVTSCTAATVGVSTLQHATLLAQEQTWLPMLIELSAENPCDNSETPGNWWRCAMDLSGKLRAEVDTQLENARQQFQDVADKIASFELKGQAIGEASQRLGQHLTVDSYVVHGLVEQEVEDVMRAFMEQLSSPEMNGDHVARAEHISQTLDAVFHRLGEVLPAHIGLSEDEIKMELNKMRHILQAYLVIMSELAEQHPELVEALLIGGTVIVGLVFPEWWLIRPLLRIFGFGPLGPVKGSVAAWAQRYFWGGAVEKGSWFAALQRAGMRGVPWFKRAFCAVCAWLGWVQYCKS